MSDTEIPRHELVDPDPVEEEAFVTEGLLEAAATVGNNLLNLGSFFDDSLRLLGYRVALDHPRETIVAALKMVAELGVALYRRGSAPPHVMVPVTIGGTQVEIPGAATYYNTAPRWADAMGAAMTLRDQVAAESLCSYNPENFQGDYDDYHDLYVRAVMALWSGHDTVTALLDAAEARAAAAKIFPERGRRFGLPTIAVARAVVAGDEEGFNRALAEGIEWYRTLHSRPPANHEADLVVPLRYLGFCALAHDRGIGCRVTSGYIPSWLVEGTFRDA